MTWIFGDGFDLYATVSDAIMGYWDSSVSPASWGLAAGRFTGSALSMPNNSANLRKASNINDAVHHFILGFRQTVPITGSSLGSTISLMDGAAGQCTIVFRSDGAMLLTSGGATGTVLATYPGAFPTVNTWYGFEIEVVIHNTAGSFTVRRNGNPSNDFFQGSLPTRGGSTNNYANAIAIGQQVNTPALVDDFLWRSDASSVPWLGDIRCFTRPPASDVITQFSKSQPNILAQQSSIATNTSAMSANFIRLTTVTPPATGVVTSLSVNLSSGGSGHARMAVYDSTGLGNPGSLLFQSAEITNPTSGTNTFTVSGSPVITRGNLYWVGIWQDISVTTLGSSSNITLNFASLTYAASFPTTLSGLTSTSTTGLGSQGMNITPYNFGLVNDPQQDGTATYVYDTTVGDADFYGIASIGTTPASVVAVTTRGLAEKSDAGTRAGTVQLKSGTITAAAPTLLLASNFLWAWRTDVTDPNTGAAWTPSAVNSMQIGPVVVS